ncbi:MAG TPA: ATP-binding protein [Geopsychrobacteraceae bacterium]|jgi:PAS domain S-box-containing protein
MAPETQKDKLFRALIDIGKELASITELDHLLERILEISREVFRFENAIIRLLTEDGLSLRTVASFGYSEESTRHLLPVGRGVMGKVASTGLPMLVADLARSDDYVVGIEGARSELAVPLIAGDRTIGVFNVESPRPRAFNRTDCEALMTMAGQAAIAIENARLYRDLRAMSRANEELHQINERILQSVSLGIYTVDKQLRITSWNKRMSRMSGVGGRQALGKSVLELFPVLEEEGIAERLRRVLATGRPEKLRLLHRGLSGGNRLQKRRLAPLKEGKETIGVVVIVEDITEFEKLLAQTIQSEKLAEVGRMSAGIAHEINNPLAVIAYAGQLLLRDGGFDAEQTELLERIDSEVSRLKTLTRGLLSFSGSPQGKRCWTDLNQTLDDVVTLLGYELNRKQIGLVRDYAELPAVLVDNNAFKQVFINLMLNAVQALDSGGELRLSSCTYADAGVKISVCDNGPGIPEALREKIFEPFFTSRKDDEGTGLGLYICRKIVADHGGELRLENAAGGGCCFQILLPAAEALA